MENFRFTVNLENAHSALLEKPQLITDRPRHFIYRRGEESIGKRFPGEIFSTLPG